MTHPSSYQRREDRWGLDWQIGDSDVQIGEDGLQLGLFSTHEGWNMDVPQQVRRRWPRGEREVEAQGSVYVEKVS